jgi:hypothetical protein
VLQRRQECIDALINGSLSEQLVGHVRGFDEALKISEQADRLLNGEDDDGA